MVDECSMDELARAYGGKRASSNDPPKEGLLRPIREGSLFVHCSEPQIQTKVQTRERGVVSLQPKNPTLSRNRDRNVLRFSVV